MVIWSPLTVGNVKPLVYEDGRGVKRFDSKIFIHMICDMDINTVIDELGGTAEAGRLFGVSSQAVSNWRSFGRFPDRMHYRVSKVCAARGIEYDPDPDFVPPERVGA